MFFLCKSGFFLGKKASGSGVMLALLSLGPSDSDLPGAARDTADNEIIPISYLASYM